MSLASSPTRRPPSAFASVILDVDSTLCGIEGVDVLAARRGTEMGARVAAVTERAMRGELPLESVYAERLRLIQPTRADIVALADAYAAALAPGAAAAIAALRGAGVRVALVSGGILQAILPIARTLGFAEADCCAVALFFEDDCRYAGFDARSPMTTQEGKPAIVLALLAEQRVVRPLLAVGDGATDLRMREVADAFAAFTGFARREPIVAKADVEIASFEELTSFVLKGSH